jgi:glycerol-3-phosphate acyltransferase PlsY
METFLLIVSLIATYLVGAIPTAYIFGCVLKKIDIRKHGSGNVGATNAFRVLGKGPGSAVLLIDIAKGIIPTTVFANLSGYNDSYMLVVYGLIAVAAHNWTVFLQFKGGKGIATTLGVLIGFAIQLPGLREVLGVVLGTWIVIFLLSGYVSLASVIASVALPIWMIVVDAPFVFKIMSIVLCVFIVIRHRSNIKRLVRGKENRVRLPYFK